MRRAHATARYYQILETCKTLLSQHEILAICSSLVSITESKECLYNNDPEVYALSKNILYVTVRYRPVFTTSNHTIVRCPRPRLGIFLHFGTYCLKIPIERFVYKITPNTNHSIFKSLGDSVFSESP